MLANSELRSHIGDHTNHQGFAVQWQNRFLVSVAQCSPISIALRFSFKQKATKANFAGALPFGSKFKENFSGFCISLLWTHFNASSRICYPKGAECESCDTTSDSRSVSLIVLSFSFARTDS